MMRPVSLTHHSCADQRYVELPIIDLGPGFVTFKTPTAAPGTPGPPDANTGPRGWYMVFLVSDDGVPSVARWMNLQ